MQAKSYNGNFARHEPLKLLFYQKLENTILDPSSLDGTRIGSPEFFTNRFMFLYEGIRRPVSLQLVRNVYATLGDTSKYDFAVRPYLNYHGHSSTQFGNFALFEIFRVTIS
jgi:hypothetical protein